MRRRTPPAQQPQQAAQQPAAGGGGGVPANPSTPEEIQAFLDNLDARLVSGEISEKIYERLYNKWEKRLNELKK